MRSVATMPGIGRSPVMISSDPEMYAARLVNRIKNPAIYNDIQSCMIYTIISGFIPPGACLTP